MSRRPVISALIGHSPHEPAWTLTGAGRAPELLATRSMREGEALLAVFA